MHEIDELFLVWEKFSRMKAVLFRDNSSKEQVGNQSTFCPWSAVFAHFLLSELKFLVMTACDEVLLAKR